MTSTDAPAEQVVGGRKPRRKTSHLKDVPQSLAMRETMRDQCRDIALTLPRETPLTKDEMESVAVKMLRDADLPEAYLGWTMVMLSSEFWRAQLASVPYERRLFLLPHCLKHAEGCPAEYDQFGLNCKECGACSIADYRGLAEDLGYRVLVAEGSPVVMKIIVGGYVDAVIGVACLNVLEKAIDKVLLAGIPCMAVPLLSSDCRNTKVDPDWVVDMIRVPYEPAKSKTRSYVHLMRAAGSLFDGDRFNDLSLRSRQKEIPAETATTWNEMGSMDPIAVTEHAAMDFLARGGKHSRPFITLAAYDAASGGEATQAEGAEVVERFPDPLLRAALAVETFHKASLVHDDIQDDDGFRYGQPSVHRRLGDATAINVGDYLIGLGYRLLASVDKNDPIDASIRADLVDILSNAHLRLSEGQGAELAWREQPQRTLQPLDALKVYALKTSPAFEAALLAGLRFAMPVEPLINPVRTFSRNLGVAFQILNDLKDWSGDTDNKLEKGLDTLSNRPTLLKALALHRLEGDALASFEEALKADSEVPPSQRLRTVENLYHRGGVFETAVTLIEKHRSRAEAVADAIENESIRRLLYFLVDTVLEEPNLPSPPVVSINVN
ncbi:MAG: polyprenyl synthetase family protein [Planctomycetota bacterium]